MSSRLVHAILKNKMASTAVISNVDEKILLMETPAAKTPFVLCMPSHIGSTMWKKLVLAASTGQIPRLPHFFLTDLKKHGVTFKLEDPTVIARSPEAKRYIIVRNPYERLLSMYLHKVVKNPEPHNWPHGLKRNDNFSEFTRKLLITPITRRSSAFLPIVVAQRGCMLAQPTPLRVDLINQWYGKILKELELADAATDERFWGSNKCFYKPCKSSCSVSNSADGRFNNCWSGLGIENKSVTPRLMQQYYASPIVLYRATRLMQADLMAFGFPIMKHSFKPLPKSKRL